MSVLTKVLLYVALAIAITISFGFTGPRVAEHNNYYFIVHDVPDYIFNNPTLFALIPLVIGVLLYFFGSMILANNWQYNKSPKYLVYYRGVMFLYSFIFVPITLLVILVWLFREQYIGNLLRTNLINPMLITLILFIFLDWIISMNSHFYRHIKAEKTSILQEILYHDIVHWYGLKIILYGLNYQFLLTTDNRLAIVFVLILNFVILSQWANLFGMRDQGVRGTIKLENKRSIYGRLIEQVYDGAFLKIQRDDKTVEFIPVSRIESISISIPPTRNLVWEEITHILNRRTPKR